MYQGGRVQCESKRVMKGRSSEWVLRLTTVCRVISEGSSIAPSAFAHPVFPCASHSLSSWDRRAASAASSTNLPVSSTNRIAAPTATRSGRHFSLSGYTRRSHPPSKKSISRVPLPTSSTFSLVLSPSGGISIGSGQLFLPPFCSYTPDSKLTLTKSRLPNS